jgi:uncharacterized protein YutE (UPF0331/DUF86 family)
MPDDTLLNKTQIILRCLARVREEYAHTPANLEQPTRQDSIILNLQRACESAIDLAMHRVAQRNLGLPQTSRDAFTLLEKAGLLTAATARQMRSMVGFRNIAIHNYQEVQIEVLKQIIEHHLIDFETFLHECNQV